MYKALEKDYRLYKSIAVIRAREQVSTWKHMDPVVHSLYLMFASELKVSFSGFVAIGHSLSIAYLIKYPT